MTLGRNGSWGKSAARSWVCRQLVLVAVLLVLVCASKSAHAQAPMCDQSGATVMAPLPAPPSDDGEISAANCPEVPAIFEQLQPGHPNETPALVQPLQDDGGLLPSLGLTPTAEFVRVKPFIEHSGLGQQLAHQLGVFRPPRS
jgi:hypothetical protein